MNDLNNKIAQLSDEKRELLRQQLLRRKKEESLQAISVVNRDSSTYPLSYTQEWLWSLHRLYGESLFSNVCLVVKLDGKLNVQALEKSLSELVKRNEGLRASIVIEGSKAAQKLIEPWNVTLDLVEAAELSEDKREAKIAQTTNEEYRRLFDLSEGKPASFKLMYCGQEEYRLIAVFHRMVCDKWSFNLFLKELGSIYEKIAAGKQLESSGHDIQYVDYAAWQKKYFTEERYDKLVSYWKERLKNYKALNLPIDNPRRDIPVFQEERKHFSVPEAIGSGIRQLSKREGVPIATILSSAFSVLMQKYSKQNNVCIGLPVVVRNRLEIESLIGNFENLLILNIDMEGDPCFSEFVKESYSITLEAYNNQEMPYARLVKDVLGMDGSNGVIDLNSIFSFQGAFHDTVTAGNLTITPVDYLEGTAGYDLNMHMRETGQGMSGELVYNGSLYSELTIEKMVGDFTSIIREVAKNPDIMLSEINSRIEVAGAETEVEKSLVEIWKAVLECDQVGIHDNFFEIGGNSLLLVRMHEQLDDKYPGRITVAKLFAYPTISKLAKYIEDGTEMPGEKIKLTLLPLPQDYFVDSDEDNDDTALKFQLNSQLLDKMLTLSMSSGVEINDVLLAIYIYLLGEVSGETDITVQTMIGSSSRVFPLRIDLTGIEDMEEIIKAVGQKRREATEKDTYPLHLLNAMDVEKADNSVGPMYLSGSDPDDELLDAYDIKMKADIRSSSISFICEYDSTRLRKSKVEELAYNYKKLIEIISERVD
jgi:hypothetical protein